MFQDMKEQTNTDITDLIKDLDTIFFDLRYVPFSLAWGMLHFLNLCIAVVHRSVYNSL